METTRQTRRVVAAASLLLLTVAPEGVGALPDSRRPVPPLFGGVHVNEADHDAWAVAVRAAGLDSVQVSLYARQRAWDGAGLTWERDSPWVVSELRAARRAGLRTVLVLRLALEHGLPENRHLWHGMIWPRDDAVGAWFERYREFARQAAAMAAREGVDLLAIGNELSSLTSTTPVAAAPDLYAYFMDAGRVGAVNAALQRCADAVEQAGGGDDLRHLDGGHYPTLAAMLAGEAATRQSWARVVVGEDAASLASFNRRRQRHEQAWRHVIADVRELYDGPVTYGANFDQYAEVGFWDALDAVGVNAYFPLGLYGLEPPARLRRLQTAWTDVARNLESAAGGLPVVFLELGWTRRSGATVRPYSYDRVEVLETAPAGDQLSCVHWSTQRHDAGERVDAMRALAATVRAAHVERQPGRPGHGGIRDPAVAGAGPGDIAGRRRESAGAGAAETAAGQLGAGRQPGCEEQGGRRRGGFLRRLQLDAAALLAQAQVDARLAPAEADHLGLGPVAGQLRRHRQAPGETIHVDAEHAAEQRRHQRGRGEQLMRDRGVHRRQPVAREHLVNGAARVADGQIDQPVQQVLAPRRVAVPVSGHGGETGEKRPDGALVVDQRVVQRAAIRQHARSPIGGDVGGRGLAQRALGARRFADAERGRQDVPYRRLLHPAAIGGHRERPAAALHP